MSSAFFSFWCPSIPRPAAIEWSSDATLPSRMLLSMVSDAT